MVYKRYNSPFEEPKKVEEHKEVSRSRAEKENHEEQECAKTNQRQSPNSLGFLDNLSNDDVLLVGLIIILLAESKENRDVPLILTLGFLFLIQYIDAD